jgi:hypothetical protein
VILPVYQEILDRVYGGGRLRHLGLMDCRHPWNAGEVVTWAVQDPLHPAHRYGEHFHEIQDESVRYRTVVFRMKEMVGHLGFPGRARETGRWQALAWEAGYMADLQLISDFQPATPGESARWSVRQNPRSFSAFWQGMARRFHESDEPVRSLATAAAPNSVLTVELLRQARDLLMRPRQGMSDAFHQLLRETVEDIADMTVEYESAAELNTRPEAVGVSCGGGYRSTPDCDTAAPNQAKPLAPLPDWLAKVDDVIEEAKRG